LGTHTTCQILCSRVIYMIIAVLKTRQTTYKKKGKLESFKKNIYFYKLDFYLNKTTTIQSIIIHLTSYIHWLTNKDTRLYTSGRHSCIELDSEVCTCHIPPNCSDRAHISNLGSHMHRVNPYDLLRSGSYFKPRTGPYEPPSTFHQLVIFIHVNPMY